MCNNKYSDKTTQELWDLYHQKIEEEHNIRNDKNEILEEQLRRSELKILKLEEQLSQIRNAEKDTASQPEKETPEKTARKLLSKYDIMDISHLIVNKNYVMVYLINGNINGKETASEVIKASLQLVQSLLGRHLFPRATKSLIFNKATSRFISDKKVIILHNGHEVKISDAYIEQVTKAYI